MKKIIMTVAAGLFLGNLSQLAQADEIKMVEASSGVMDKTLPADFDGVKTFKPWARHEHFKLTEEQRKKMREVTFHYKENKIYLEQAVKLAHLNYEKVMTDPSADQKTAKAAAQDIVDSVSKMVAAKLALKNQISFQILTEEQRKERAMHPMWMKKHGEHKHFDRSHGEKRFAENAPAEDELTFGSMISMESFNEK